MSANTADADTAADSSAKNVGEPAENVVGNPADNTIGIPVEIVTRNTAGSPVDSAAAESQLGLPPATESAAKFSNLGQAATMADVAAHAGVSHQTVSRVLNDHPRVAAATREKVMAAIEQLGYRRSSVARALATGDTKSVGILVANGSYFGTASSMSAISLAAQQARYFVSIAPIATFTEAATRQALNQLVEAGVEGIIVVASNEEIAHTVESYPVPCPVVLVGSRPNLPTDARDWYVYIDQAHGTRLAVEYLIGLGHKRIWHIAGPDDWFDAVARRGAYVAAMEAAGLTPVVLHATDWSARRGYDLGKQVAAGIRGGGGPTAVCVGNDLMAIGLYRAVWEAGLHIPNDLSVVGFDDVEAADFVVPRLTTVRQPFYEVGAESIRVLLAAINGAGNEMPQIAAVVEPELIIRESAAAA